MTSSIMRLARVIHSVGQKNSSLVFWETRRAFRVHSRRGPTTEEVQRLRQDIYGGLSSEKIHQREKYPIPQVNNPSVRGKRSALFSEEKARQAGQLGRIDKIEVNFVGKPEGDSAFIMNKGVSTPFDVAKHLSELHTTQSIVADVNGQLWDMHRPLEDNCTLKFLHMKMKDEDPFQVNRVFWRSCSMMLGCIIERALQDHIYVELHSFPSPNVRSGSFVYDVDIKLKDWHPNSDEMRVLSSQMLRLGQESLQFERLDITKDLALEMFQDNQYKQKQIPEIAATSSSGNTITVYRIGEFVDISKGPMMSNTNQLGRVTVTSLHPLQSNVSPTLYRLQGVALPANFLLNHFAWSIIESRGRKLNTARIPGGTEEEVKHLTSEQAKEAALA